MSDTPIYQQLFDQIVAQILSGELQSETALPSIRTMAKELRVSIITIKKSWEELEKRGYIKTVSGKGSYVSSLTNSSIEEKRIELIKDMFKNQVLYCKTLDISKKEIFSVIEELYNDIKSE